MAGGNDGRGEGHGLRLCVFTRAWRSSGTGLFAQELVDAMVAAGAEVTFVCPRVEAAAFERPRPGLARLRPPRERVGGAGRLARLAASLARIGGGALSLLRARLRNRVFVVSVPDPLGFALVMLAMLRLTGARIVYVAHDPTPHAWRLSPRLRWLEHATYGACYRIADTVVVLSEPTCVRMAEAFSWLRTPVAVIDHGVFLLDNLPPLPGDGVLLSFGTLRRNKGVLEGIAGVIAARAAGVPVRLVVAGEAYDMEPDYAQDVAALAATAPDTVHVRVGYVDDAGLAELFGGADAVLMPYGSFHSQSGVALLAASNARPLVATAAGGLATLIAEGAPVAVIDSPVSAATVADAVAQFLAEPPAIWRERAARYRAVTLERRGWDVIARRYLALIGQL